tara:strand:+ start:851 stop:1072 length:222 start_codon:yes stop_codon:yes gene_type:complete
MRITAVINIHTVCIDENDPSMDTITLSEFIRNINKGEGTYPYGGTHKEYEIYLNKEEALKRLEQVEALSELPY